MIINFFTKGFDIVASKNFQEYLTTKNFIFKQIMKNEN